MLCISPSYKPIFESLFAASVDLEQLLPALERVTTSLATAAAPDPDAVSEACDLIADCRDRNLQARGAKAEGAVLNILQKLDFNRPA